MLNNRIQSFTDNHLWGSSTNELFQCMVCRWPLVHSGSHHRLYLPISSLINWNCLDVVKAPELYESWRVHLKINTDRKEQWNVWEISCSFSESWIYKINNWNYEVLLYIVLVFVQKSFEDISRGKQMLLKKDLCPWMVYIYGY